MRRDYGVARFLHAVDLPCPPVALARRVDEDFAASSVGSPNHPKNAVYGGAPPPGPMLESPWRERKMALSEISRRLGDPPPVPRVYSREFYSRIDKSGFDRPTFAIAPSSSSSETTTS